MRLTRSGVSIDLGWMAIDITLIPLLDGFEPMSRWRGRAANVVGGKIDPGPAWRRPHAWVATSAWPITIIRRWPIIREQGEAFACIQSVAFRESIVDIVGGLVSLRSLARRTRNFREADGIRARLMTMGVTVTDHPDGSTTWRHME